MIATRDGLFTHVLAHEVVLCEDRTSAMVYVYFGAPGDDPGEVDVCDIVGVFYDLDAEADFDAQEVAASFASTMQSINDKTAFRVC